MQVPLCIAVDVSGFVAECSNNIAAAGTSDDVDIVVVCCGRCCCLGED